MNQSKLEVITLANNKDTDNTMNQSKLEVLACNWQKARENLREWIVIGFDFTSDWMRNWREMS